MKIDIRDMFDDFHDETVDIKTSNTISSDKILELTFKKIQEDNMNIKKKRVISIPIIAAAVAIMLSATAFAAYQLLSPKEIASHVQDYKLAEAFTREDTKFDFAPQISGDYTLQLLGILSGTKLSDFTEVNEDKSYIVGAISRSDGTPLTDYPSIMVTPLFSGYKPWQVNVFTIGGGRQSFIYDGVNYFILECTNIEIFADHTIYIAMYEGMAPGAEEFTVNDDGSIRFNEDYQGVKAMFILPVDPSKADPAAVKALLDTQEPEGAREVTPEEGTSGFMVEEAENEIIIYQEE